MKLEKVVAMWVAALLACVAWVLVPLAPWPAKLREPWGASDLAAWVQAVGSIVAIAAGAMAIRWQVLQEARREAARELRNALQEVIEVQELVEAACEQVVADRASCISEEAARRRSDDRASRTQAWVLGSAFESAHLDHIASMRVRLAFIRARGAYQDAVHLYGSLFQNLQSSARCDTEAFHTRLLEPIGTLQTVIEELSSRATGLRAQELGEFGQ